MIVEEKGDNRCFFYDDYNLLSINVCTCLNNRNGFSFDAIMSDCATIFSAIVAAVI